MTNYEKYRDEDEGISFSDVVNELHYLHMLLKSDEVEMAKTRIYDMIDIIESQIESQEENKKVIRDE